MVLGSGVFDPKIQTGLKLSQEQSHGAPVVEWRAAGQQAKRVQLTSRVKGPSHTEGGKPPLEAQTEKTEENMTQGPGRRPWPN
jgi:hypothetical protein